MCLAVPGQIVSICDDTAMVDFQGNKAEVCTVLTPEAVVNDWVLVHAGFAITCIDADAAQDTWSYLQQVDG